MTGISRGWTTIVVPISGGLMLVYLVPRIRRILQSPVGGFPVPHGPIE